MKNIKIITLILLAVILTAKTCLAAVGCDLSNPDRDVKRFFPQATSYKTSYESIDVQGGDELFNQVQNRLGDNFTGLFETIDVPYTVYTILKDNSVIGYIHGTNQRAAYGGMQVFLIFDRSGVITDFYFQRLTSKASKELRSEEFAKQFIGLSLKDFTNYNVKTGENTTIKNPVPKAKEDFLAALRGTKKNLILMDVFIFNRSGNQK